MLGLQIAAVLVLTVVLGETYLAVSGKVRALEPELLRSQSLKFEPSVFAAHVFPPQEQKITFLYWVSEWGSPTYFINAKGYRGHDFSIEKPKGSVRVMIYGGSSVFDLAMPEGKDWPHRVEQFLREDGFKNAEVINAGIPGHTAHDALGRFFAEGHQFKPDYVILYTSWNDIKRFSSNEFLLREEKPYVPASDPRLYYQNGLDRFLGEHSSLYIFLRHRYLQEKIKAGLEGALPQVKKDYQFNQRALDQFRLNIALFVDCVREAGAVPILMTEGSLIKTDNDRDEPRRLRHVHNFVPFDFAHKSLVKAREIIKDVAQEKQVELIDAEELLIEKNQPLFVDHVHLRDAGSRELARIVKEKLAELLRKRVGAP